MPTLDATRDQVPQCICSFLAIESATGFSPFEDAICLIWARQAGVRLAEHGACRSSVTLTGAKDHLCAAAPRCGLDGFDVAKGVLDRDQRRHAGTDDVEDML